MNFIFLLIMVASILIGTIAGRGAEMTTAALASGGDAIMLCLSLAGAYALWCGMLEVLEEAGAMKALARWMRPIMGLFPGVRGNEELENAVAANLSANMLGLGNAATPAGIDAMKGMKAVAGQGDTASDAMCMFLVVNASSIQLLPTTVISLRAAAGAAQPFDIFLPSLAATACSTLAAILCMKLYLWGEMKFARNRDGRRHPLADGRGAAARLVSRRRGI